MKSQNVKYEHGTGICAPNCKDGQWRYLRKGERATLGTDDVLMGNRWESVHGMDGVIAGESPWNYPERFRRKLPAGEIALSTLPD